MKKILMLFAAVITLSSCQDMTFQKGVVIKTERIDSGGYGYRYCVTVDNVALKGITNSQYTLLTNYNYRIGDTITIK